MKADYIAHDGSERVWEYEVIVPQQMEHSDGFSLFGFNSWEEVVAQKLAGAVTGVIEFHLDDPKVKMGFHSEDKD